MATKPNFFIVGQPKSGTTALFHFLKQHPDIFITRYKEPSYFCKDFHEESRIFKGNDSHYYWQTEESYLGLFTENKLRVGDASTNYLYSKVAAEEIFKFDPDAKIIMMFREPVDFLYSWHSQCQITDGEHIKSFAKALAKEPERKQGKKLDKRVNIPSHLFYYERIKYTEQAERFFKLFPKENIKVIIYEDFIKDNQKIYEQLLDFLGLNNNFTPKFEKIHDNQVIKNRFLFRLAKSPWLISFVVSHFSIRKRFWLKAFTFKYLLKKASREPLEEELKKELKRKYLSEVIKFSDFLGRDLVSLWGYDQLD